MNLALYCIGGIKSIDYNFHVRRCAETPSFVLQVVASDNAVCTLQITDTGGSHSFPAMERLAIQRGQAFILVYSVNNRKSFENLKGYYNEILSVKSTIEGTPLMIVGNKCDCVERDVSESEGLRLAKQWSCSFIETSAKQEFHTRELFEQLLLLEKRQSMSLTEAQTHKKSGPSKSSKRAENIKNKCSLM